MSLFSFDAIHFHKTEDMFLNRELLKEYKGKVILTSHTPCAPYKEIIGRLNPKDYRFYKKKIDALVEMDRYAFERADYIIFPCEEAEEPYFHTWNSYSLIRKPDKYHYMPTGIVGCKATVNREEYRRKLGIPNDAFVVSYAGRHNEIKGYGELKKIGEKLLLNDNVWFLIAGREGPLYKLNNSKWIEIGWTTDPHSMIAASDIFVLPNKETYFDLILLEVLSLGVPVTISATGGNKYFNKFGVPGIKMYHTIDEACEIITKFKDQNYDARIAIGNSNLELFRSEFTVDKFAENYVHILNDILK
jgi:glycosyltransferase involved in cell wall biosynthesis